MATDLPWNGAVRRKAPEEGLGGFVSGISVSAGRQVARAVSIAPQSSDMLGGAVQGAKIEAVPIEMRPSGIPSRPNGRLKLPR